MQCERVEVDDEEYCVYSQPITETGYDCPPDLAHGIPFEGGTVCSGQDTIPEGHRDPLRDHVDDDEALDGGHRDADGDVLLSQLCTDPSRFNGTTVTLPGDALEAEVWGFAIECPYAGDDAGETDANPGDLELDEDGRTCCNHMEGVFHVECEDWWIVINPDSNMPDSFHCSGDNCGHTCDPAKPENIESVTGVFRYAEDGYTSDHDYDQPAANGFDFDNGSFDGEIRVSEYELRD